MTEQLLLQWVRYPLAVASGKSRRTRYRGRVIMMQAERSTRTRAEFLREYGRVLTPPVRKSVSDQDIQCLFGNRQGTMAGNGEIWFDQRPGPDSKIIHIHVPEAE